MCIRDRSWAAGGGLWRCARGRSRLHLDGVGHRGVPCVYQQPGRRHAGCSCELVHKSRSRRNNSSLKVATRATTVPSTCVRRLCCAVLPREPNCTQHPNERRCWQACLRHQTLSCAHFNYATGTPLPPVIGHVSRVLQAQQHKYHSCTQQQHQRR